MPGEVVVGFASGAGATARAAALESVELRSRRATPVDDASVLRLAPGTSVSAALAALRRRPGVAWAEPNALFRRAAEPNDPAFAYQWGLRNLGQAVDGRAGLAGADIHAGAAWDVTVGSPAVRVAVVDGGIDAAHPDLAANVALGANPGESGGGRETNGVDDDGNGLVDDWRGWDFHAGDNDARDEDQVGHGTHVASIIAARGNDGAGVAGVAWVAGLIPIRAMSPAGEGDAVDVAAALAYAAARGARVVNVSLGSRTPSRIVEEAIAAAPNTLFVVAAGNTGDDLDAAPTYPCAVPLPNVVCVTATDQDDRLPGFANHGHETVHLAAPGDRILGAQPGGGHRFLRGTSFAAPYVAGAAALLLAARPGASTAQVRAALLAGVDPVAGLAGRTITGGRLNAAGALAALGAPAPGPPVHLAAAEAAAPATVRLAGRVTPRGRAVAYHFEHGPTPAYGAATPTRSLAAGAGPTDVSEVVGAAPGQTLHYRLVAGDVDGVTLGPDQVVTAPPADPAPEAPAQPPDAPSDDAAAPSAPRGAEGRRPALVPGVRVRRAARPRLAVRRAAGRWFLTLRLGTPSIVTGRLERRPAAGGRSTLARAYARVLGIRRRGLPAGARRIPLGRLRPGIYRVTLEVRSGARRTVIVRPFRVAPANARR